MTPLNIALCYESVLPSRGGAETYLGDLSRRLAADGHAVHLYACRWDATALPPTTVFHPVPPPGGPRFVRPWLFARAVHLAVARGGHDVTVGFDKTYGQDVLYPQGGLHAASRWHNRLKFRQGMRRQLADAGKFFDPANRSFARLERLQYLGADRPEIVVNSRLVAGHFERFLGVPAGRLRVIHSAIDPARFAAPDRAARRDAERGRWGVPAGTPVGLFVAMNYRLKGLAPLIEAVARVPAGRDFRVAVVGHPKDAAYRALADRRGVAGRFLFLGFRRDPQDAYFAADFLAHPTFYDPCSLVALEAVACGLPVVTTRYNGASELLGDPPAGVVVDDPHDAGELGAALERMIDPATRAEAAGRTGRAAAAWTFEDHYRALVRVFAGVRDRKRAGGPTGRG